MFRKVAFALIGLTLGLTTIAFSSASQSAAGQVAIPDSPPGHLLENWLDSFNSGDLDRLAKFLTEHDSEADRHAPPRQAAQRLLEFRERVGGGFDFYKMEESSASQLKAILKERGGFGWAEVVLKVDAGRPNIIASIAFDQVPAPPESRPAREDQAALTKDLDQLLETLTAQDRFSGVVLLAKGGKPFFQKAYGYADREKKIPNNLDTKFCLGPMNKMFTSVAIAQLVQQGKLSYIDTVAKLLPDYPTQEVAAKITVHQLLTHTSGLGDFFGPEFFHKKDNIRDLRDYLQFFASQPLKFEPGTSSSYSNAGMIVAGLVVERVSGQNYFDYVSEHIYKPAGMADSGSYEKNKPQPNQSTGYTKRDAQWISNYETMPLMGSSAGGGYSTAPDLLRFDQAQRGHKLLNAELTTTITTGKVKVGSGAFSYAYGFGVEMVDGKRSVGHNGGAPGMNANLDMFWDSGYTLIVLANLDPPIAENVTDYIRDRIQQ